MVRLLISSSLTTLLIWLVVYAEGNVLPAVQTLIVWAVITMAYYINNKGKSDT